MPELIKMRVKPLILISVLIILLTTGISCFNRAGNDGQGSFQDFQITDVEAESVKLQDRANEAIVKAREWQSDAYLFSINIAYENTKISQGYKPVMYFASSDDGYKNDYIIEVEPDLSALASWEELPRLEEEVGVEFYEILDDWQIGYAQALQIADENGGGEFRSKYTNYQIILDLYKNYQVGMEWGVYYTGLVSATEYENLSIYLDAVYGEVTEITS